MEGSGQTDGQYQVHYLLAVPCYAVDNKVNAYLDPVIPCLVPDPFCFVVGEPCFVVF